MMSEEDYDEQLAKAGDFHGEICGGIAIGTKLAMYGLDLMGMELNQRHKNLIVFLEIDRCMADAVQAVTKCSMGKRSLKQMYYGKFAVTFYNMDTGEALRVSSFFKTFYLLNSNYHFPCHLYIQYYNNISNCSYHNLLQMPN